MLWGSAGVGDTGQGLQPGLREAGPRGGEGAYPELRAGVGEEVHLAEVVTRGQEPLLVGPADGVDVRSVRALWPHS